MVSIKTKESSITAIDALLRRVAERFDTADTDAERDFLAAHCPPRLEQVVRRLPTAALHLLDHLGDESVNLVTLADRAGALKGTVSKQVQHLVAAGLVTRSAADGSRKQIALSRTADGRIVTAAHTRMHAEMTAGLHGFLAAYSAAELAVVAKVLGDLARANRVGVRLVPAAAAPPTPID